MIKNYSVSALRALIGLDYPDQHHLEPPPTGSGASFKHRPGDSALSCHLAFT